jgi:hypothetical protein
MKTLKADKCSSQTSSDQAKPGNEIRMGREVPIIKKGASCHSGTDAKCAENKDRISENAASSLV